MSDAAFQAIVWDVDRLKLIDQRLLPNEEVWLECTTLAHVTEAISNMVVRGAPAIGIAACYGVYLLYREVFDEDFSKSDDTDRSQRYTSMAEGLEALERARPTAVNLMWAVKKAREFVASEDWRSLGDKLLEFAQDTHRSDLENNFRMGQLALKFFQRDPGPFSVMTHCNTGSLATGGHGTALGAIREGYKAGCIDYVHAGETRPWLQGTRLTAWELARDNIPFALSADSSSAYLMKNRTIKWVIVGADRVTANGDTANKIGTYSLAILAKYHDVRFMVVAPTSTIDLDLVSGDQINIEMRDGAEVTAPFSSLEASDAINPVFDVTPASLIDVLVTEKGAIENPNEDKIRSLLAH